MNIRTRVSLSQHLFSQEGASLPTIKTNSFWHLFPLRTGMGFETPTATS